MAQPRVLVTGGAGYIGSHVVKSLRAFTDHIVVIDNLSTGFKENVMGAKLYVGDLNNLDLLKSIFFEERITAVMHFAASISVPESIQSPLKYYDNNLNSTVKLLQCCEQFKIRAFILSSTAAIYGMPETTDLISEQALVQPISPYGASKAFCEQILRDAGKAFDLPYLALRYFNVAGSDADGDLGQRITNSTNLIKAAVETACGKRDTLPLYGTDYETPDGTCIRDFIHISDLANAHILALEYLLEGGNSTTLNCGYGHGSSVKEVIDTLQHVSGKPLSFLPAPRRLGDAPVVVADNSRIKSLLNWHPKFDDLSYILKTALSFEQRLAKKLEPVLT
jgi:UDP-glucose 4-epimerase